MAFFRKASDVFGLDIGSSAVKALKLKETGGTYRIEALGIAPLPPDAAAVSDAAAIRRAIATRRMTIIRRGRSHRSIAPRRERRRSRALLSMAIGFSPLVAT